MKILIRDGLPFISVTLDHQGTSITLDDMVLDTGSSGTLIDIEQALRLGIMLDPSDHPTEISGVGGNEYVYEKTIERVSVGTLVAVNLTVEIGIVEYGIKMNGIVGMNFLTQTDAVLDFSRLEIVSTSKP